MKLSERIQQHINDSMDLYIDVDLSPDGDNEDGLIESVQKLELDSLMLSDLMELFQFGAVMQMHAEEIPAAKNYYFAMCGDLFVGTHPREAIALAIKNFKETK